MAVLTHEPVKRVFTFEKNKKKIDLPDFNPALPPESIIKFYAGTYPELTNAKIQAPDHKGNDLHFNIGTEVGTLG